MIYLDYNATTPLCASSEKAFKSAFKHFGNPSSLYQKGRDAKAFLESARETVASSLGASHDQLVFTGSGTEGNNHVIASAVYRAKLESRVSKIFYSAIEHSSILNSIRFFETMGLLKGTEIPVDATGAVSMSFLETHLDDSVDLVSVMWMNNETGRIQDINALSSFVSSKGVLFHTDAVQAFGKIPIDVSSTSIDFLTVSSHKIYGPKGIGALYVKAPSAMLGFIHGGSQERRLRAGTENVPSILAFEAACKDLSFVDFQPLKKFFLSYFDTYIPLAVCHNPESFYFSNTLSIALKGVEGHALAIYLDLEGVSVSTGSACSVGSIEPSHVLSAMGISDELNRSTIRVSFGKETTQDDLLVLLKRLENYGKPL